jgi:hypothetical protein
LGVDCWGQSSDECPTVDGSGNSEQMAAGVVSPQILEGTRPRFVHSVEGAQVKNFSLQVHRISTIFLYKRIRKVDQEILSHSSHSRQ